MARKAKEDEAAALEFDKWKGEFSVDAEGTTEGDLQDEGQGLLTNFVEYIKVPFYPFTGHVFSFIFHLSSSRRYLRNMMTL